MSGRGVDEILTVVSDGRRRGDGWAAIAKRLQDRGYVAGDLRVPPLPEDWTTVHGSLVRRWARRQGVEASW